MTEPGWRRIPPDASSPACRCTVLRLLVSNLVPPDRRLRWWSADVERTLAWITRHRRTVRDYERLPAHHESYVYWAMIIVMTRRLARQQTAAQSATT